MQLQANVGMVTKGPKAMNAPNGPPTDPLSGPTSGGRNGLNGKGRISRLEQNVDSINATLLTLVGDLGTIKGTIGTLKWVIPTAILAAGALATIITLVLRISGQEGGTGP